MVNIETNLFDNGGVVAAIENNYILSNYNKQFLKDMISTHLEFKLITKDEANTLEKKYLLQGD